jgi:hypothetical protein
MQLKSGDLITHRFGYRAVVLTVEETSVRICVFYHPDWSTEHRDNEIWALDHEYLNPHYVTRIENGV